MFYTGTLEEGIAAAVQQAKLLVCFVTDGQSESKLWEAEFLADESLKEPLESGAVIVRIQAGSTEAGYLAAIFPLPKIPTLVMIRNGRLEEYIASGTSKEEFIRRASRSLGTAAEPASQEHSGSQERSNNTHANENTSTETSSGQTTPSSTTAEQPPAAVQGLLAERAARLEAQRKKEADEARRLRLAKANAKAEAEAAGKPKANDPQSKHAEMLKRKQKAARDERRRILQAIEDDKAARRARKSERESERNTTLESQNQDTRFDPHAPSTSMPSTTGPTEHCALQVRLLDGSAIRNRFPSGSCLGEDVRKWIDGNRQVDRTQYTFKVVLTPLSNKAIGETEERLTLHDLGLTPSSTLILVPATKKSVAAYPEMQGNQVSRLIAYLVALITGFFAVVINFFMTTFSAGRPGSQQTSTATRGQQAVASGRDRSRVRGFQEPRERRNDQQFYNGNSTNFEPRRDEEVKEE